MKIPRIKNEILVRREEDDFYVINTENGETFKLNRTATEILENCKEKFSLEEIIVKLSKENKKERDLIKEDVLKTIKKFIELGFTENE